MFYKINHSIYIFIKRTTIKYETKEKLDVHKCEDFGAEGQNKVKDTKSNSKALNKAKMVNIRCISQKGLIILAKR